MHVPDKGDVYWPHLLFTIVAGAAEFISAATLRCALPPNRCEEKSFRKSDPRKVSSPVGAADRAMSGNRAGFRSYVFVKGADEV
jgi:hypothetical protein